jgi:ATP-dependent RNA helicase DDX55/SPB4
VSQEERPYIELLRGRGVPLLEKEKDISVYYGGAADQILERMKHLSMEEREVLEAGSTAFMSFLRAYKENLCSYIFRLESLDIGAVARSYGLLRLPKIPETRGIKGKPIRFDSTKVNTSQIPYRHKEKEEARLRRLAALIEEDRKAKETADTNTDSGKIKSENENTEKAKWVPAEEFAIQRDKEDREKELNRKRKKKQSPHQKIVEEWDELSAEEMAYKKFKKGKMTQVEYDRCLTSDRVLEIETPDCGDVAVVLGGENCDSSDGFDDDYDKNQDDDGSCTTKNKKQKGKKMTKKAQGNVTINNKRRINSKTYCVSNEKKTDYRKRRK